MEIRNKILVAVLSLILCLVFIFTVYPATPAVEVDSSKVVDTSENTRKRHIQLSPFMNNSKGQAAVDMDQKCTSIVDPASGDFCPWYKRMIPSQLREFYNVTSFRPYNPKRPYVNSVNLNLTVTELRRSRSAVGNVQRLHTFLKKVVRRECTKILVLGGSVARGHNAAGTPYPKLLITWLNKMFPCQDGEHELLNESIGGITISVLFENWHQIVNSKSGFDLVILAYNVNDLFVNTPCPYFLDRTNRDHSNAETLQWYMEIVIRKFLVLRKPGPVAIMAFMDDYNGRVYASKPWFSREDLRKSLLQGSPEHNQAAILSMYEIPTVSASRWMLAMASKRGQDVQFNKSYPWSTSMWHTDACCHPMYPGHKILAMTIYHCWLDEIDNHLSETLSEYEEDLTARDPPILRTPVRLSEEEDKLYMTFLHTMHINFMSPLANYLAADNSGNWVHIADNKEKDKWGLIANRSGAHISFKVKPGPLRLVSLVFLASYKDFGRVNVWMDGYPSVGQEDRMKLCTNHTKPRHAPPFPWATLDGYWNSKASIAITNVLRNFIFRPENGADVYLHFCTLELSNEQKEKLKFNANKFKILSITTR